MKPPHVVIIADAPNALVRVCGVTMLDRLLRTLQRAGFDLATVLTRTPDPIRTELAKPSWARNGVRVETRTLAGGLLSFGDLNFRTAQTKSSSLLLLSGAVYLDPRLIEAVLSSQKSTGLVDSDLQHLVKLGLAAHKRSSMGAHCGAYLLETDFVRSQLPNADLFAVISEQIEVGSISVLDVAKLPTFLVSMRRDIRPQWFPAPSNEQQSLVEKQVLDTAQKGAMEMVSYLETPVENWLMRWLWNTSITPLQITFFGVIVGLGATIAFVSGHLWIGAVLALSVGVIDGLDGKQARVKVETTELGRWEGEIDYPVQMSWWIALAYYFAHVTAASNAIGWVLAFLVADVADKIFTRLVKRTTGRYLESYAPIDGVIRFFGGPRSLYVCLLICGLLVGQPYGAFVVICCWHLVIACLHGIRAGWICSRRRRPVSAAAEEVVSAG